MNALIRFLLSLVGKAPCAKHQPKSYRWTDSYHHTFEVTHCPNCQFWKQVEVRPAAPVCERVAH